MSGRSERRGFKLTALPAEGYSGQVPRFPLPRRIISYATTVDGVKTTVVNDAASDRVALREAELWEWAWRTPQACAWAQPSESWRLMSIAMWVRTYVICEGSEATAADKQSLHRFGDDIGMTPAGLRANGWAIAADEVAVKRADKTETPRGAPKRRLRSVGE